MSVRAAFIDAGYDPVGDFEPVIMMGVQQMAMIVPSKSPVHTVKDLVALAKSEPGKLNFTTAGVGSIGHLQLEHLKQDSGVDIVHVPFAGTPQAMQEIMAGRADASIITIATALPQIKAGTLRAIAVQGDKRAPELPDVPTMAEAGFPDLGDAIWYMVLVPKGTPKPIVDKLNAAMRTTLADPTARTQIAHAGVVTSVSTPEDAARYLAAQAAKWKRIVKTAHIVLSPGK
jgi:tripartite-type tricarboxylate transporter receptor subunit TctC